ncbi:MAG TPA: TolC family protein, partial [Spirochaetota bacterium]|nr:TolC family protein [Spirochaetota bacterium]
LQNNPDIRLAVENQNGTMADYRYVKALDRLQVNGELSPSQSSTTETERVGKYNIFAGLVATYPLVNPGQGAKEEMARRKVDISKIQEKDTKDQVLLSVKTSYYQCIAAHKNTELRDRIRSNFAKRFVTIKGLVQTGDRPILDQSMAEVSLSQSNLEYQQARNREKVAESELRAVMGVMTDSSPIITDDFPDIYQPKYSIDEIYNFIDQYCSDVQIARSHTEIAREGIWHARSMHLPEVNLIGFWGRQYNNLDPKNIKYNELSDRKRWEDKIGFAMAAKVSIFNGGAITAQTDSAIADYNKAIYNERKVLLLARKNAQNYLNRLNELRDQIEISRLNIENSRVNLNLAQRSYDSGIGSQIVVQNAEMSLLQSELNLIGAKMEYFSTIARLANLVGIEENELCGK